MRNWWTACKWFVSELPRLWRVCRHGSAASPECFVLLGAIPLEAPATPEAVAEFYEDVAAASFRLQDSTLLQ